MTAAERVSGKKKQATVYTCSSHKGPSSEIKLVSVAAMVDGQQAINLTLICLNCLRAGATLHLDELWPDAKEITEVSVRGY